MKYTKDRIIILGRVNYGERDRVLTVLGSNSGKVVLMAKGTRTAKSKLAGSIELFCEADIQYVQGRGRLFTLTDARLYRGYPKISDDIESTMLAYEFLKILKKILEEGHGHEYYAVLSEALRALNDNGDRRELVKAWFGIKVLQESGHLPGLQKDSEGKKLQQASGYNYDFDRHCFLANKSGKYSASDVKLLRVLAGSKTVPNVEAEDSSLKWTSQLVEQLVRLQLY